MRINGMTVCVTYSDFLEKSISRWESSLDTLTIVTHPWDVGTLDLAAKFPGVRVHRTRAFYHRGAMFNKGAAMEEARLALPPHMWDNWFLFFDSDIVPEPTWRARLERDPLDKSKLYGAWRHQCGDLNDIDSPRWPLILDAPCDGGYFHLFHTSISPQSLPLLETCWPHAGVYDSHFKNRWPADRREVLPIRLTHLGDRENWCGRGNTQAMNELKTERLRRDGYQHERIV